MGEVYGAYDPELDRKVAIKLLRSGGSQDSGPARLMREAQAIAKLSHPNVVTVFDVGTFRQQVFIAMQFVDGQTVGYWLNATARPWTDVLRVFASAGRGLAAAHEKQIVHRDFKPDNVMIGKDDQVRVMDFGLARLATDSSNAEGKEAAGEARVGAAFSALGRTKADDDLDQTNVMQSQESGPNGVIDDLSIPTAISGQLTQVGSMLGTPAYMAPEQFLARPTDPRTDQFSFCVALYEGLYGQRPFAGETMFGVMASVTQGQIRPSPAGSVVPPWIRSVLLRGLAVSPDDRWPSMNHLLAELEKKQVVAGHRGFAAAAAAKLAGIWEAPSRRRWGISSTKASIKRAFAATDKKYAATVFENVSRILDRYAQDWAEMYISACEATHLRGEQSVEVLDLRMAALQASLADLKALCDTFRSATPTVVENAVSAARALPPIERCADIDLLRAVIKPPADPAARALVDKLRGDLARLRSLSRVGRLNDALALRGALEQASRQAAYGPLLGEVLLEIGILFFQRGDPEAAVKTYEEAVWTAELCRHDEVVADAAIRLVFAVAEQSRFDAGDIWAKLAETTLRRVGGHGHLWGWLFNNMASSRHIQGRLGDALALIGQAISAKEKTCGTDDPDLAISICNMGLYLSESGDLPQAVQCMERALGIFEAGLGPEHPTTAILLSNYSEMLNQLSRFEDARHKAQRALAIFERETDPDGLFVTSALTTLGIGFLEDGQAVRAMPLLERASRNRESNDAEPSRLGEIHFALARALRTMTPEDPRALTLARRAREEYGRAVPGPPSERACARIDKWLAFHQC